MTQKVFVNRTLNLKKIQYIGFDMDHTLVRYNTEVFESLTHKTVLGKLVNERKYPKSILELPYQPDRVIRGLVVDRKNGNLLKLNRYSGIRASFHGTKRIDFLTQKKSYKSIYIDLGDPNYLAIDTAFSISLALIFAQLVDLSEESSGPPLPDPVAMSHDIEECVDEAHRDGTLKNDVQKNLAKYIIKDPAVVKGLERYKRHDKKLFLLTNSDYAYTKLLLDYAINPFLQNHDSWLDLFEIVITSARKPRFFYEPTKFLKVNTEDGSLTNHETKIKKGVYQGGGAKEFTASLNLGGDDVLYIGDHIYGDILRLKKDCNWRTALVIEELDQETAKLKRARPIDVKINHLMTEKRPFEDELLHLQTVAVDKGVPLDDKQIQHLQSQITAIDRQISQLITEYQNIFNKYWGEVMRAGAEESYFAYQVERYACIYMPQLKDLLEYSPKNYFRAAKRALPHEMIDP